jgi:3-oxoacyl-[acyl-carrier-protein] synthase III
MTKKTPLGEQLSHAQIEADVLDLIAAMTSHQRFTATLAAAKAEGVLDAKAAALAVKSHARATGGAAVAALPLGRIIEALTYSPTLLANEEAC